MLKTFIPERISSRILALILFILVSNALLTGIFSQQYQMQAGQAKTAEALHAAMNYIDINGTPLNIDKVLSTYEINDLKSPPKNVSKTKNTELLNLSAKFNFGNKDIITFYEDATLPKVLYIKYEAHKKPPYWLSVPQEPINDTGIIIGYFEEIFIVMIILTGSYITAQTINAPLKKIMKSLKQFGSGTALTPVKEEGPTEIRQLAISVNQMIRDQEALNKERELMLAGISHDLRTPLTRLQLLAEMSSASSETINDMKNEIDQITKMQQQFIDYVSASNNEKEDRISVNEFCTDLANKYKVSSHIIEVINHTNHEVSLNTQPIGLYRVLTNGINNAIKYGDAPYRIEISENSDSVTIDIKDAGNGVPDASLKEIFKPLFRGDFARRNADGSGLGLAIVARIVHRLGGTIRAKNLKPKGFCLSIVLPSRHSA